MRGLALALAAAATAFGAGCGGGSEGAATPGEDGGSQQGADARAQGAGHDAATMTGAKDATSPAKDGASGAEAGGGTDSSPPPIDPNAAARYPDSVVHAPLTTAVMSHLQAILATGQRDTKRFLKMGDANCGEQFTPWDSANMFNFAPVPGIPDGVGPAITYFLADKIPGPDFASTSTTPESSFLRYSFACAESGTAAAMLGPPSLLDQEVTGTNAAFALVMLGGVEEFNANFDSLRHELDALSSFDSAMLEVVDELVAHGVVPVIRAFPDKTNCTACIAYNPGATCDCGTSPYVVFNLGTLFQSIVRGIAEGRQLPFADDNVLLANEGAKPGDWLDGNSGHLTGASSGDFADFTNMKLGYAVDSLIAVQQLERMREFTTGSFTAEANPGPARSGSGTAADPFVIDPPPFTDLRSFANAQPSPITDYSSCSGPASVGGPAYFYKLVLTAPLAVRVLAYDRMKSPASVFVRHFVGSIDIKNCQVSQDAVQTYDDMYGTTLAAGTHYFVVQAPTIGAGSTPPEFGFVVQPCPAGDPRCQ